MRIVNQTQVCSITCADPSMLLSRISQSILIQDVQYVDQFTIQFQCPNSQYQLVTEITEKMGGEISLIRANPIIKAAHQWIFRPIIPLLVAILLVCSAFLPTRILFFQVNGNNLVSTRSILSAAENCGIYFGSLRSNIRSEQVKNKLLEQIPELQWVGVNTSGCVVSISVLEKSMTAESPITQESVGSIIAATDGIILQLSATSGTALCKTGQAVKEGQVLISGYTDNGLTISAVKAAGEVQALTSRSLDIISPRPTAIRGEVSSVNYAYAIRIGKKLINLKKDSGISSSSCAKIYSEDYVCLPGGFQLPISFVRITEIWYNDYDANQVSGENFDWVSLYAQGYLQRQMIAGEILSFKDNMVYSRDCVSQKSVYICREMIGRIKYEENIYRND
ncbi:MAG: sporulation protein YqfD [Oscillospiraceae bacterium]|nr:sporulation protein YqfD [Oscillospiraceae bacterium]